MKSKIIILALMLSLTPALANASTGKGHGFRVPSNSFVWHPYHPTRNHRHF